MSKAKLLIYGCICMFLISCGSPAEIPPTVSVPDSAIASTTIIPTPQSDGGTDVIEVDASSSDSDPKPTATAIILNTVVPSATPTTQAIPLPPESGEPVIREMRFFDNNNPTPADQFVSPNEVFVQFEYANIPDGTLLKRDWYFNNSLFISREEAWDEAVYGQDGIRNDISIFDYETGLAAGVYQLNLFLDGNEQENRTFVIELQKPNDFSNSGKVDFLLFRGIGPYTLEINENMEQPIELFAYWSYLNMRVGDVIRRDWYYDNALLVTKEEVWDFAVLGESGWHSASIFDYETGLLSGSYRVELFVNDVFQISRTVEVVEPYKLEPFTETVSGKKLLSDNLNTVTVINPDGSAITKAVAGRIHSADWFLGGDRLIFSATTLTDPTATFPAFAHSNELWLWDLSTDKLTQIGTKENRYHSPRVSPNGQKVAVLSGTGYGDAGVVDSVVVVFEIDKTGAMIGSVAVTDLNLAEFDLAEAFPWTVNEDETYRQNLVPNGSNRIVSPGHWVDDSTLRTSLGFSDYSLNAHGTYDLNFDDLTAERVE